MFWVYRALFGMIFISSLLRIRIPWRSVDFFHFCSCRNVKVQFRQSFSIGREANETAVAIINNLIDELLPEGSICYELSDSWSELFTFSLVIYVFFFLLILSASLRKSTTPSSSDTCKKIRFDQLFKLNGSFIIQQFELQKCRAFKHS